MSLKEQEQLFGPSRNIQRTRSKQIKKPKDFDFQQLEDLIRCSICFEKYQRQLDDAVEISDCHSTKSGKSHKLIHSDDTMVKVPRVPRILSCSHTFCQSCILNDQKQRGQNSRVSGYRQNLASSQVPEIRCPYKCDVPTRQNVENLMIDQTVLKIIDHLDNKKKGHLSSKDEDEKDINIKIKLPKQLPKCENCAKNGVRADSQLIVQSDKSMLFLCTKCNTSSSPKIQQISSFDKLREILERQVSQSIQSSTNILKEANHLQINQIEENEKVQKDYIVESKMIESEFKNLKNEIDEIQNSMLGVRKHWIKQYKQVQDIIQENLSNFIEFHENEQSKLKLKFRSDKFAGAFGSSNISNLLMAMIGKEDEDILGSKYQESQFESLKAILNSLQTQTQKIAQKITENENHFQFKCHQSDLGNIIINDYDNRYGKLALSEIMTAQKDEKGQGLLSVKKAEIHQIFKDSKNQRTIKIIEEMIKKREMLEQEAIQRDHDHFQRKRDKKAQEKKITPLELAKTRSKFDVQIAEKQIAKFKKSETASTKKSTLQQPKKPKSAKQDINRPSIEFVEEKKDSLVRKSPRFTKKQSIDQNKHSASSKKDQQKTVTPKKKRKSAIEDQSCFQTSSVKKHQTIQSPQLDQQSIAITLEVLPSTIKKSPNKGNSKQSSATKRGVSHQIQARTTSPFTMDFSDDKRIEPPKAKRQKIQEDVQDKQLQATGKQSLTFFTLNTSKSYNIDLEQIFQLSNAQRGKVNQPQKQSLKVIESSVWNNDGGLQRLNSQMNMAQNRYSTGSFLTSNSKKALLTAECTSVSIKLLEQNISMTLITGGSHRANACIAYENTNSDSKQYIISELLFQMNQKRSSHCLLNVDNQRIYALGGKQGQTSINSVEYIDISSLSLGGVDTIDQIIEQMSNQTWKNCMSMKSFRQNFGACAIGDKDERKILIYGYGSGQHQPQLGFYPGISPQRIDGKQPKLMTFELFDTISNIWCPVQVKSGISAKDQHQVLSSQCSHVCLVHYEQTESLEKKAINMSNMIRDNRCDTKIITDKIIILQSSTGIQPTEVLLLTYTQKFKVPVTHQDSQESSAFQERATNSFFQPIPVTKLIDSSLKMEKLGFLNLNRKVNQSNCLIRDKNLYVFGGDPAKALFTIDKSPNTLEIFNLKKAEENILSSASARTFGAARANSPQSSSMLSFSTQYNLDYKDDKCDSHHILPLSNCPSGLFDQK